MTTDLTDENAKTSWLGPAVLLGSLVLVIVMFAHVTRGSWR